MPGWESYASVLRTPDPQFSYFLVAVTIAAWVHFRRLWILALPVPFLYFFVALGYCLVMAAVVIDKFITERRFIVNPIVAGVVAVFIAYVASSVAFWLMLQLYGGEDPGAKIPKFTQTRTVGIPVHFAFLLTLGVFVGVALGKEVMNRCCAFKYGVLISMAVLLICNMQVINGFTISYKNIYDYAVSLMTGIAIAFFLQSLFVNNKQVFSGVLLCSLLTVILSFTFSSLGCSLSKRQCKIWIGFQISQQDIERVRDNPLGTIAPEMALSAKLAYGQSSMMIPPFSYQYHFMPKDLALLEAGLVAAKQHYAEDSTELNALIKTYNQLKEQWIKRPASYQIDLLSQKKPGFVFIDKFAGGPFYVLKF